MLKVKLFMTMQCNLRCSYCYEQNSETNIINHIFSYDLLDLYKLIVTRLHMLNDNIVSIEFYGGEPLIEFEKIKTIIEFFNNKKTDISIQYAITTNGTLITPEISKFLKANSVSVFLSLDGDRKSTLDRKYKSGELAYSDILNGLKKLQYDSNRITINLVVTSKNYLYLIDNLVFLKNFSLHSFSIAVDFFDKEWLEIDECILKNFYKSLIEFCLKNDDIHVNPIEQKIFPLTQCTLGETLAITPNGDVFPCIYFPTCRNNHNLKLGHITEELNWSLLATICKEVICENKDCPSYNRNCNIGCYGKNVTCTGDLYTPSSVICKHLRCSIDAMANYKFIKSKKFFNNLKVTK